MKKFKKYFGAGLAIVLPVLITIYFLGSLLKFLDNLLGRYINAVLEPLFGIHIFGAGIVAFVLLVLLAGMFAVNYLGKKLFPFFENMFIKIPLVQKIYPATKDMVHFLIAEKKTSFKKVVMLEYPRKGIYSLGFIVNDSIKQAKDAVNRELYNVFVPSSPSPLTGYFVLVPKEEFISLEITIEQALKMIVSGGVLNP